LEGEGKVAKEGGLGRSLGGRCPLTVRGGLFARLLCASFPPPFGSLWSLRRRKRMARGRFGGAVVERNA
jgi:hypothetical protein